MLLSGQRTIRDVVLFPQMRRRVSTEGSLSSGPPDAAGDVTAEMETAHQDGGT